MAAIEEATSKSEEMKESICFFFSVGFDLVTLFAGNTAFFICRLGNHSVLEVHIYTVY